MENGYYITLYVSIGMAPYILGLDGQHDQNVALWYIKENKLQLVHYWELERLSGQKQHAKCFYGKQQLLQLLERLISSYGLTLKDIRKIWGMPDEKLSFYGIDQSEYSIHSISHLYSAVALDSQIFYEEKVLGLVLDGAPNTDQSKFSYIGCYMDRGNIDYFPVFSPAMLWWCMARRYKMKEGSLMALGSASSSRFFYNPDQLLLINKVFPMMGTLDLICNFLDEIEGEIAGIEEKDAGIRFTGYDKRFTFEENRLSMIVKIVQDMSMLIVEKNIEEAIEKYSINPKQTYLAGAGGFVLNCACNSLIMARYGFKGFLSPPCVNDSGISLGLGLFMFHEHCKRLEFSFPGAYMGNQESTQELQKGGEWQHFIASVETDFDADIAALDIMDGPIAWFEGRSEVGPRALGHRSILADPRNISMKSIINEIKQRQWWRPVAPVILEEFLNDWFEDAYLSPFMLHAFHVRNEKKEKIPAALHLDGTARVQTVSEKDGIYVRSVIKAFADMTEIPLICNTSLNDRNEPIIDTVAQAINFCLRKKLKILYVNGCRITLQNHEDYGETKPLKREEINNIGLPKEVEEYLSAKWNPYGIPRDILMQYMSMPELKKNYDIKKEKDAAAILQIMNLKNKKYMETIIQ